MVRSFFGFFLGTFFYLTRFRFQVVRANWERFVPHPSRFLIMASYYHFGCLCCELLLLPLGRLKQYVLKHVTVVGSEHLLAAHRAGRGFICVVAHSGNWEIMAAACTLKFQVPLLIVTKSIKPKWLHRLITSGRAQCGVQATYEPQTMRDILAAFKRGDAIGVVLDQYVGPPVGVRVPFFGVPVGTASVVAVLAKRYQVPVLLIENWRSFSEHHIVVHPPFVLEQGSLGELTAQYVGAVESAIDRHPAQWLWTHRRFKGNLGPLESGEWDLRARV